MFLGPLTSRTVMQGRLNVICALPALDWLICVGDIPRSRHSPVTFTPSAVNLQHIRLLPEERGSLFL